MRAWCGSALVLVAGCSGSDSPLVLVDLITDYRPVVEMDLVRTELVDAAGGAGRFTVHEVDDARADFIAGVRVAELADVPQGDIELLVSLESGGRRIAQRSARVVHAGRTGVTIVMQRDCGTLACAAGTACYAGRCVDPRCTLSSLDRCGEPQCASAVDCASVSPCASPTCVGGACLYRADDAACAPGAQCDITAGCRPASAGDAGSDGGAVRDGGMETDAGLDQTACDDLHAGRQFCDGFEAGDFSRWDGFDLGNGDIAPVSSPVFRGRFAARVSKEPGETSVFLGTRALVGLGAGADLYVRVYFYLPGSVVVENFNLLYMGAPGNYLELTALAGDILRVGLPPGSEFASSVPGELPRDRWVCLEVHYLLGPDGVAEVLTDGEPLLDLASTQTPTASTDQISIGLPWSPATQGSAQIFLDEVVVSTTPIGCD